MHRIATFVTWVSVCFLAVSTAGADPVTITSGSIVLSEPRLFQAGSIAITGTRGFSITGRVSSGDAGIDPLRQCFPCEPRSDFSVGANLSTLAISGRATLDGETYDGINTLTSSTFVFLNLVGTTVLPPVSGPTLVIQAPFSIAPGSFFNYEVTPGSSTEPPELARVALTGGGTATVRFLANASVPVWEFDGLRYDFAPVPEPATLSLVIGGLAATLLRARSRRRKGPREIE